MYVLGTAGHVDHGKSTLVERLTGIDPDRLSEEKARGLTIDLGFAWLTLPRHGEVGIVDVPGHERFVSNMLAGAGSIDASIFVVAANEGWKPQSEEHLAILDLLGARGAVVALTKRDLVTPEELAAVTASVAGRLEGTALEGAEIVAVAAPAGDGIDLLRDAIERMLDRTPPSPDRDRPRLFVDRSFSIKGAGTIVTGTLTGGRLAAGDEVAILPRGTTARVRGIQAHKRDRAEVAPGSRVAINLAGVDRGEVARGDVVVRPDAWRPTTTLDVAIRGVRGLDHPVTSRGAYRLHLGSAEVEASLRLLDVAQVGPGLEAFARLSLDAPVVAEAFDRFVLRDRGRDETVAGGQVLDPHPARDRLRRGDVASRVDELRARRDADREGLLARVLAERGAVAEHDLPWVAGVALDGGPVRGYAVSPGWLEEANESILGTLARFHASSPLARGMPREDVRTGAGLEDRKLFAAVVDALGERVTADGPLLRLASHRVTLTEDQRAGRERVLAALAATPFSPPPLAGLAAEHGPALLEALADAGEIVRISREIGYARDAYEEARRRIAATIREEGPVTASRIRDALGTSRKHLIPLLEHLDAVGFTKRDGDARVLGDAAS